MANMTLTKTPMPEQDPQVRARNFEEVALGYTAEQAMEEAGRCLGCKKPKCVEGCPVNVRIPEFIAKVAEGDFQAAYEIVTSTNALPALSGRVCGMKCIRMELGEPDASGRRRPVEIPGSEFILDVDTVIMALGTSPNPLIRSTTPGLETNKKGCLIVNEDEMTTREGVFAGGDAVTGAATVILAMGAGKKGAAAIDAYLQNKK